ncbi:MAG: hypothetical protein HUJ54_07955 [Erysipelotrichaceae bacterium]|nr:hypothetical protein [Erysipelotrichaceae bacterium]
MKSVENTMEAAMLAVQLAQILDKKIILNSSFGENTPVYDKSQPVSRDDLKTGEIYVALKDGKYLSEDEEAKTFIKILGVYEEEYFHGSLSFKKAYVLNCQTGRADDVYCHHFSFYRCIEK